MQVRTCKIIDHRKSVLSENLVRFSTNLTLFHVATLLDFSLQMFYKQVKTMFGNISCSVDQSWIDKELSQLLKGFP